MEIQPLEPRPEAVADLVRRLVDGWPGRGADPLALLPSLGFTVERRVPQPEVGEFVELSTPLARTTALLLRAADGEVGLSVFVGFRTGQVPQSRRGYHALLETLRSRYGEPTKEWGSDQQPACCWYHGGCLVEMYTHARQGPSVQIGVSAAPARD